MRAVWVPEGEGMMNEHELRAEFERLLTEDSETKDARRRDFNQALFYPAGPEIFAGASIWSETTLGMVMAKYDRAVKNLRVRNTRAALDRKIA